MKGSYVLLLRLPAPAAIPVGRRPAVCFSGSYYAYVGSAMGGLEARIRRHLKPDKKRHWHIDFLLRRASVTGVIMAETDRKVECALARALSRDFDHVPGFGASDCSCPAHLFRASDEGRLEPAVLAALNSLSLRPRHLTPG